MAGFTHFDKEGKARMVDVSEKAETERIATARGSVIMQPATLALIKEGGVKKGDLLRSAADAIERGQDVDDILHHLTNYMSGRYGIWALQHALKRASVAVGQSNVVPLFGGGKDAR